MNYDAMPLEEAYRLIGTGPVVLAVTRSADRVADVAPIAWACPARKSPCRVLLCVGKSHKTWDNIEATRVFTAAVPNINQAELVRQCGSTSGHDIDKYADFDIAAVDGEASGCRIPDGVIGFIECKVVEIYDTGPLAIVLGEALAASVDPKAYDGERLLGETPAGKTLHHLGGKRFLTLSDDLLE